MPTILGHQIKSTGYGLMGLTINGERGPSDEAGIAALEAAYAEGIHLWNAGEFYGPPHRNSLQLLNKYFTKHPDHADKIVLSVKGGNIPGQLAFDGSRENMVRSIEECLKQLDGKKKLDIFEAARVDPKIPIEKVTEVIAEYVKKGKIGGISLSECSAESIKRAAKVHKIECVEVEFSLWATEIVENGVAKACAELDIPVIAYSPLGRGFLTGQLKSHKDIPEGDFRKHLPRFQPDTFDKNLELVKEIEKVAKKKGVTAGQIGIAWVVKQSSKPGNPTFIPIPGSSTASRIKENAFVPELTDEEEREIDAIVKNASIEGERYAKGHPMFGDSPAL